MYQNYNYNKAIIENLYQNGKYKQIIELTGYVVVFENALSAVIKDEIVQVSLKAYVWSLTDEFMYERYSAEIYLKNLKSGIRKILIEDIFKQIIKNKIMML